MISSLKIMFWGTYDKHKPRHRILLRGLKENNVKVTECHVDIWKSLKDKSLITNPFHKVYLALNIFLSYPVLLLRFLFQKKSDIIMIGYPGHIDLIMIYPLAKIFKVPIVWDTFISLYDTIIHDRNLLSSESFLSKLLYLIEYLCSHLANLIITDTYAHSKYFKETYHISIDKTCNIPVGFEPEFFLRASNTKYQKSNKVLFYGQFIPLHGIDTIIETAKILEGSNVNFTIIGSGQESVVIDNKIKFLNLKNITRIKWVNYEDLIYYILDSDICLGIFGNSDKASRVIPNKVFQILASGKPLITRDSPAIREILPEVPKGIDLIPPANAEHLSRSILKMFNTQNLSYIHYEIVEGFTPSVIGHKLIYCINNKLKLKVNYENISR